MQRLKLKKSIADAAVDGVVPEKNLRSPAQAYQDIMGWLQRLDGGDIHIHERETFEVVLAETETEETKRTRKYGDFSKINHRWNASSSSNTHQRLKENVEEWQHYHALYREARKDWKIIPYEEMIKWAEQRSDYVIGDFGCGEAMLAKELAEIHTVHSFDHVAINEDVTVCDLAEIPLEDQTLDIAIFCLSLMGNNFTEYIQEAHRVLKLDGQLHIIEATSRFKDRDSFAKELRKIGFRAVEIEDISKFTYITAIKSKLETNRDIVLKF